MFGSRRKNRRKRSPKQRRQKRREALRCWARRAGFTLALVIVGVGLPLLIFWGYSQLMDSDYLALTYVDVEGLNYLEEDALLDAAEEVAGENLLSVQSEHLEMTMATLPFVADVEVERRFPDRLYITIEEYDPRAILVDDGLWLVDTSGEVFLELEGPFVSDSLWQLPLITGLTRAEMETEEGRDRFSSGLEVIHRYEAMGLADDEPISEVHIDDLLGVTLVVGDSGTEVRLGWGRWEERLERLDAVQTSLIRRGMDAAYILIDRESDLDRIAVGQRSKPGSGEVEEQ